MKKSLFYSLIALFLFSACSKEKANREANSVWIRIENASDENFDNGQIGVLNYGSINTGVVTTYKKMEGPIYAITCQFTVNGNLSGAGLGVCGTPLPPPIPNGYYTLKILRYSQQYYPTQVIQD